ncbi:xanthine dehydrogenase family protein molybdopterin-binding subunit [Pseudaminobacter sp. 19-2017]|uniref:Xanthine dehydrogenase family protein molybdopterin-binding subunit n=1 Tax=Pseudaminobacter soli (ex Zhang et al. 2022) TaxID=2831468 RepID=A0A942IAK3_9HYPH|nr:xanthine dehydrogenase family protein molybdopterin-binding subunit [Pseudaminobacter soli]MBS3650571.1 xanthine dehydrogenase family protein molybdopterin-binding subunit [Pseudaminobacter soli]
MKAGRPRHIGARVQRFEDIRLLSGSARYIDDVRLPDMLHLMFVRSDTAHARIRSVDTSALSDLEFPTWVFTGKDTAGLSMKAHQDYPEMQYSEQPLLAEDRVRFVGEPVAVVLAEDAYKAEDAAEHIFVDYEPLPVVGTMEQARDAAIPPLFDGWKSNVIVQRQMKGGDLEAAKAAAAHVVKRTYRTQRQAGVPMEGRGVVARYDHSDRVLTVWSSTQMPHLVRTYISEELGLPESRIRVVAPDVGGGFGVKGQVYADEVLIAWVAMKTGRPVKWIEDRREHLIASIHARDHEHTLEAYVSADGRLLGLKADITVDNGAYSTFPFTSAGEPGMVGKVLPGPYDFHAYEATFRAVATNKCAIGTYRGVARPSAVFSQERLMDDIATELGMDPFEFRLKNIIREFPYRNVLGFTYDAGSYAESLERMRKLLAEDVAQAAASHGSRTKRIGVGIACFIEQTAHGTPDFTRRRVPIETGYIAARVEMSPDGEVTIDLGLQNHGQGLETTMAQVAADALGVQPENVYVRHGDTLTTPYSVGTWGSRGGPLGGGAVHIAASRIADKLRAIAAHLLQARPDEIELADGLASVRDNPGRHIKISRLARIALRNVDQLPEGMAPGLEAQFSLDGPRDGTYSNAVHAAVVEIDVPTGKMKLRRFVVIEDCGTILNPLVVDGQVRGGVVQGIGSAMFEHFIYDGECQPLTTSFADYLMPLAPEIPNIEVHHIETPTPLTPLGAKGLGEGGAIGPAAAIANAVSNALGVNVSATPLNGNAIWNLSRHLRDAS